MHGLLNFIRSIISGQNAFTDQSEQSINDNKSKIIQKGWQKTLGGTDLHREELVYEWKKHHLFTVPHLFGIDLYSASELPPLPTVLHEDLNTCTRCVILCVYTLRTIRTYMRTLRIKKAHCTLKQMTMASINTSRFSKNLNKTNADDSAIQNGDIWISHSKTLYENIPINLDSVQMHTTEHLNKSTGHQRILEPFGPSYY